MVLNGNNDATINLDSLENISNNNESDNKEDKIEVESVELKERPLTTWFKVRWIVASVCAFTLFNITAIKVCLSLSAVAMVHNETILFNQLDENITASEAYHRALEHVKHHIDWSATEKNRMLEAVFWGAFPAALPGGRFAERFGPRKVIFVVLLTAGVTTLLYPVVVQNNFYIAYLIRVIHGFCLGIVTPAVHVMITRWSPTFEKSIFVSVVQNGSLIGNLITHPLVGYLSSQVYFGGWPAVFYLLGLSNIIGCAVWTATVTNDPEDHPFISSSEIKQILDNRTLQSGKNKHKVPWAKMLSSVPVLTFLFVSFVYGWLLNMVSTQLPSFYDDILHLDLEKNGLMISLPYLVSILFSSLAAWLVDFLRKRTKSSNTLVRKTVTFISLSLGSLSILVVILGGTNQLLVISFFTLAKGFSTIILSGAFVVHLDMSPTFAGTLMGIAICLQNFASLVMNETLAYIVGDEPTAANWYNFLYLTSGITMLGAIIFCLFGGAELLPWDPTASKDQQQHQHQPQKHVNDLEKIETNHVEKISDS